MTATANEDLGKDEPSYTYSYEYKLLVPYMEINMQVPEKTGTTIQLSYSTSTHIQKNGM